LGLSKPKRKDMTTELFGTEFATIQTPRFNSAFKADAAQRKNTVGGSLMGRRTVRRNRRANRSL